MCGCESADLCLVTRFGLFWAVLTAGIPVFAATYTVTTTSESGAGSLRQAILDANATPDADLITFNIPGAGPFDLQILTNALPIITNSVTIDGFTQSGSGSNTLMYGNNADLRIRLYPHALGLGGLHVRTNNVTIRGLSFQYYQVAAIYLQSGVSNLVEGCLFGTDTNGLLNLGGNPGYMAVRIADSSFNRIGGTNAWQHNLMAFGGGAGVGMFSGAANTNNAVLGNSIFAIGGLGIDLEYDHRTLNDAGDADTGANNRQNFPVLTNAALAADGTLIQGSFHTAADGVYRLEFFSGPVSFRPDYGYARYFIGWTNVTTDGTGAASFSFVAPNYVPAGYFVCATGTDTNGNTSEFSDSRQIPSVTYLAIPIGSLGHQFTQGNDLNSFGEAVGFGYAGNIGTNTHAFIYTNGVMADLGTLGGFHSFARAINDSRVVVGDAELPDRSLRAFRWAEGSMQDLGLLPGTGTYSAAMDINSNGQIVGYSEVVSAFPATRRAFLWQNNVMTDLGTLPGHFGSEAWAIAENGDIFGASWTNLGGGATGNKEAFLYRNGVMTRISSLTPLIGLPARFNRLGDLAVSVNPSIGAPRGFAWLDGQAHDLGLFGGQFGQANEVNDHQWTVGFASTPGEPIEATGQRAFVFRDGTIYDLNTLLANNPGATLRYATSINNDGMILANSSSLGQVFAATLTGTVNSPNATNVFLLIPIQLKLTTPGSNAVLSWFTDLSGFSLQSTTDLVSPGTWANVPDSPVTVGNRHYFTNNLPGNPRYFRLFKP